MPKIEMDSEDIQLLEAIRGFVDGRIATAIAEATADDTDDDTDVPFEEDAADEDVPAAGTNVWTRQELDAMGLKDLRQLAKDLGLKPAGGGLAKKTEIFDFLERNKRIVDEAPDTTDAADEDDEPDEEGSDDDVTFEDLLDKDKFPFKDLLLYADENEIEIPDEWRSAKASNRRKIARELMKALGEADEEAEEE